MDIETINHAENKEVTDFSNDVKRELWKKLDSNPEIQVLVDEIEKYNEIIRNLGEE